jgi:DNA-binding response OmpR family regulator
MIRTLAKNAPSGAQRDQIAKLPSAITGPADPLRVAHLDRDSGLCLVTAKRLERLEHEHHVLPLAISPEQVAAMDLDALILDVAILGSGCWRWLESLHELQGSLGIIVCTGSSTAAQRVHALRMGVDDWLNKPCHPEELVARVEAVVRRRRQATPRRSATPILAGELEISRDHYQVLTAGRSIGMTRREFQLVELLATHEGSILERELIYELIWGYVMNRGDRSVDVFVRKARRKLERTSPEWRYIHTHFGVGYRFAAELIESSETLLEPVAA